LRFERNVVVRAVRRTDAGKQQTKALIELYLGNAKLIREAVKSWGLTCIGGDNAPYLWINTGRDSWEFFDLLLNKNAFDVRIGFLGTNTGKHILISHLYRLPISHTDAERAELGFVRDVDGRDFEHARVAKFLRGGYGFARRSRDQSRCHGNSINLQQIIRRLM